jgi:TonB family protein
MAYQALLFCPEEKTARTVTQVLSELEFTTEPCSEPFAAVKKLMSQHFDAIVVDCDNEQNATLLFKSARNSTSNQASLAVAIVEGQAGVAKAFRIGANLVLTKPINVEQSKGTLRVARGLLRKGEPLKPATAIPSTASSPAASTAMPAAPVPRPVPAKPPAAPKPEVPAAAAATATPRPASTPVKPPTSLPAARAAVARAAQTPQNKLPAVPSDSLLAASALESPAPEPMPSPATPTPASATELSSQPAATTPKPKFIGAPEAMGAFSAGAAPAPAREVEIRKPKPAARVEVKPEKKAIKTEDLFETPAAQEVKTIPVEAATAAAEPKTETAPSFTFGGANLEEQPAGSGKKIGIGIAAVVLVAGGLYFAYSRFQGHDNQAPASPLVATSTPSVSNSPAPKPSSAIPAPGARETRGSAKVAQPATSETDTMDDDSSGIGETSTKTPASSSALGKSAPIDKPAAAPLVVKSGTAPSIHTTAPVSDTSAPSAMDIATPGSNGALSNIVGDGSAPQPVLQTLNISQGVSQGLLLKKVQPVYPQSAMMLHIEGNVELQATISKSGMISHLKVLKGDPQLTKPAVDAVKQWKYKPYLLDGQPVEVQTQITIVFKLPR